MPPLPTFEFSTFLAAALGSVALLVIAWAVAERLRRVRLTRLESRYIHRWSRLTPAEKTRVLQIMGLIPFSPPTGRSGAGARQDDSARLDRLFRAVLAESGKDLGLAGTFGFVSSALPLALLDAEVEWALSEGTRTSVAPRHSAT